jgi:hypothetical protein
MIEWMEVRRGFDSEGDSVDVCVLFRANEVDVANLQRAIICAPSVKMYSIVIAMTTDELIEDFITVHQARRVQE